MPLTVRLLTSFFLLLAAVAHGAEFDSQLDAIRKKFHLPALAAAATQDGKIVENAASGLRQFGEDEEVTLDDAWHLGSCTKSMTATLAAMLVDEGKIKWTSTVSEIFPELKAVMDDEWAGVTLELLLSHRGGAPAHAPDDLWMRAWQRRGTPTEQRLKFMAGIITHRPETTPGTKFVYSNQGYAIAGAMLERASGKPWEEMMQKMLFDPLGMHTAGFGAPGEDGAGDQPWGHTGTVKKPEPVPPGPEADNPPAIGPAGTVHCSIADLARYAAFHAAEGKISPPVISPESFAKLHTRVPNEDYSMGWVLQKRKWAGGDVLMHSGSNTMWYCVIWVAPLRNAAFVAATNCATELADDGCDAAIKAMVDRTVGDRDVNDGE